MPTYKVKENLSIGKDTYDILDENEQLLYKVKGKDDQRWRCEAQSLRQFREGNS